MVPTEAEFQALLQMHICSPSPVSHAVSGSEEVSRVGDYNKYRGCW